MSSHINRRTFTKAAMAGAAAGAAPVAARAGGVIGANDRVRIACIGLGYRGVQDLHAFLATFEANGQPLLRTGEIELRGTLGTLYASMNRIEIIPERGGAFQDPKPRIKPVVLSNQDGYKELRRGPCAELPRLREVTRATQL